MAEYFTTVYLPHSPPGLEHRLSRCRPGDLMRHRLPVTKARVSGGTNLRWVSSCTPLGTCGITSCDYEQTSTRKYITEMETAKRWNVKTLNSVAWQCTIMSNQDNAELYVAIFGFLDRVLSHCFVYNME